MKEGMHSRISSVRTSGWLTISLIALLLVSQNSLAIAKEAFEVPVQDKSLQHEVTSAIPLNVSIKQSRRPPKGNPKLGSSLNKLLEKQDLEGLSGARTLAKSLNMVLQEDRIQVTIVTSEEAAGDVRKAVEAIGGKYQLHYRNLVQALVPLSALGLLAERTDVQIIREPRRAIFARQTITSLLTAGNQTTEGVAESNASVFHSAGYDGTGVRVAVIDAEFAGYAELRGTDLPAMVNTYDWTGTGMGGGPHGTACAEVIYDMAPGVTLDLHKVSTPAEFGNAVDQAIADGANIISASINWPLGGPGDGTGLLADIVSNARSNGIFYAASAGNSAEHCWSGTFTDTNADDFHEWVPGGTNINGFGRGDGSLYLIPAGLRIIVGLHWDDWTSVDQDYDLLLVSWNGSEWELVEASNAYQNGGAGQTPEEYIDVNAPVSAYYGVVVAKYRATRNVCFRLTALHLGPRLNETVSERSLTFPADSPDAITVGAVDVSTPYPLEVYSSRGPTFGPGGACSGGSIKPDVAGYANVSTVSYGPGAFPGTSAAAPHVAGAAALLKDAYPSYTVAQLQGLIEAYAVELGESGKDNLYGAGRLYLELLIPTATTEPATSVTSTSATLNGTVNPNGSTTTYYFEYGMTQSYGSTTTETDIGSGTDNIGVSADITISDPIATYHYRLVATNTFGTVYGADITFTNDTDADAMPDDWEQQIIDDDPDDSITRIEDVLPDDDYDEDALTNLEEYRQVTVPTDFDTDDDDLPDGWEVNNGLDPLDPSGDQGGAGDIDSDGWTNYEEYVEGTDPRNDTSPPPSPPQVMESTPHDGAGLGPETPGVPSETSFAVRISDSDGINITDTTSIEFTVDDDADDPLNTPYPRDLSSGFVRLLKLTTDNETQVTDLWVVYDRSQDTYGNFAYNRKVNVKVDAKDRRQDSMAQASFDFRIESEAEHDYAQANLPDTSDVAQDDPDLGGAYDVGVQVNSGNLEGAKILYDSGEPIKPTFGPTNEVPPLNNANTDAVGVPINLQPPTVFNTPVRIFIPCPGYTDVSQLSVFLYNGTGWVLACNAAGIVQSGAVGWMVPGSRVNHNNGNPSTIEIQVYHFSGVQSGLSSTPQVAGGGGGGGGGCLISTLADGFRTEK